jgi:hypothetical protein
VLADPLVDSARVELELARQPGDHVLAEGKGDDPGWLEAESVQEDRLGDLQRAGSFKAPLEELLLNPLGAQVPARIGGRQRALFVPFDNAHHPRATFAERQLATVKPDIGDTQLTHL